MKLDPIGKLSTQVEINDVISLFVTSDARYLVTSVISNFESNEIKGQFALLRRLRATADPTTWYLPDDAKETSITITDKPLPTRNDHYTRVYVHGHADTTIRMEPV